ncbi:MAG TPA: hypothetical protein VE981_06090 [Planctomycetota bacterium]|nr:hypothetical protein [Planctomycetota bacterium]
MRKLLAGLLVLAGVASSGCIVVPEEGRPYHHHCYGCGHVYVKGGYYR